MSEKYLVPILLPTTEHSKFDSLLEEKVQELTLHFGGATCFFNRLRKGALRAELKDTGGTVTCLMPGATETEFFERADMLDTKVGQSEKDDPADVAKTGFDAMMSGEGDVVSGWKNKIQSAIANFTPAGMLAEKHRKMAGPGSARKTK